MRPRASLLSPPPLGMRAERKAREAPDLQLSVGREPDIEIQEAGGRPAQRPLSRHVKATPDGLQPFFPVELQVRHDHQSPQIAAVLTICPALSASLRLLQCDT
jgi:hypothetical protein